MISSLLGNHPDRSHDPLTLIRQGREAPSSACFPAPDAGHDKLQKVAIYHQVTAQVLGGRIRSGRRLYREA
jgi:hypothetical protein